MQKLLFLLFFVLPFTLSAQQIKSNVVDGFTNERTIETSIVTLKQGFSAGFGVSFTSINNNYFLNFIGYGKGTKHIEDDDRLWFVLDDGSVVKFNSRVELESTTDDYRNLYIHHYYINLQDLEALTTNKLMIVRIVSPGGANDIAVNKRNGKIFARLCDIFYKELNK